MTKEINLDGLTQTAAEVRGTTITEAQAKSIASLGGAFTLMEDGIQNLETVRFEDDEIEALLCMPVDWRMGIIGQLIELAESLRESLREIDGRIFQVTNGRLGAKQ